MKERPILFSAPMVRAILEGRKTQTRRVVKPHPVPGGIGHFGPGIPFIRTGTSDVRCPYGQPGERLWVRETWAYNAKALTNDALDSVNGYFVYSADIPSYRGPWRPSIHMPRAASRILLEITGIRVERLNDISDRGPQNDCTAEGVFHCGMTVPSYEQWHIDGFRSAEKWMFRKLWESINGAGSWSANPWVWVVEFKRVTP